MFNDKELWSDIASHFNVDLGEKFDIEVDGKISAIDYRFSSNGLEFWNEADRQWEKSTYSIENNLLHGVDKVKKRPWKPNVGEVYYRVCRPRFDDYPKVGKAAWFGDNIDFYCLLLGNVFQTQEEAKKFVPVFESKVQEKLNK